MMSFYSGLLRIAQDYSGLLGMRGPGYFWLRLVTPGYIGVLGRKMEGAKVAKRYWQKDDPERGTEDGKGVFRV